MAEKQNILRQIKDIQVQASRLIEERIAIEDLEAFFDYSNQLKSFLTTNLQEEFILKYVHELPELNLELVETNKSLLMKLLSLFAGGSGSLSSDRINVDEALDHLRFVKGKYASIELLLQNYFD